MDNARTGALQTQFRVLSTASQPLYIRQIDKTENKLNFDSLMWVERAAHELGGVGYQLKRRSGWLYKLIRTLSYCIYYRIKPRLSHI